MSRPLYHFTCDHHVFDIVTLGRLRPGLDGLVWMTDLPWPRRQALGLTSHILDCDRTAHRFRVTDPAAVIWWPEYAHRDPIWAAALEAAPGAEPHHWYVSTHPVPIELATRTRRR